MANTTILKQEVSRGYVAHALDYDAQGKAFLAIAIPDPNNPNIVRVPVWMAQRGQPFPQQPIGTAEPVWKIDSIDLDHTGTTLVVSMVTHEPKEAPRNTAVEAYTIPNVWATTPGFEAERGGEGGYTGSEQEPGGEEVDYARIQEMINTKGDEVKHWVKDQLAYVLRTETVPAVHDGVVASLSGDPGPIADLLYRRIADGTWEQLGKFGNEVGYKPPRGGAPSTIDSPAVGSGPKE
jgi:hypothetical protein